MKRINRSTTCLIFAILLVLPILSEAKSYKTYNDVPVPPIDWQAPHFEEFTLPNGLAGVVVEDHEIPMVNFYLLLPASPDPMDKVGLADFAMWVLRNGGSKNVSADSLNELIEFKAASIWINGGDEYASIWGNCLSEDLPLFLSLTSDLLFNPAYPEEKIELHRSSVLEGIRRRNDEPRGIARRELYKILYANHPWGVETNTESINSITREDLLTYHKSIVRSDGVVIGFSGDINLAEANRLTGEMFGALKKGDKPLVKLPQAGPAPEPGVYYAYKDINQAFIAIGHRSIKYDDPRRYAAEIMNYVLGGGGFQSILMKKIRVDAGLSYGVGTAIEANVGVEGSFRGSTSTRLDQSGRTLAILKETINGFVQTGPSRDEFQQAKDAYVNSFVWRTESSANVLGQTVYYKWRGFPLDTPQRDLTAYQKLTYDDVVNAARELLHPDQLVIVVVGNREKMDRPLEDFGTVRTIDLDAGK